MDLYNYLKEQPIKESELDEFKSVLDEKSSYDMRLLDQFEFTSEYFDRLNQMLLNIAYVGNQDDIEKVRVFVQQKIVKCSILKFNAFLVSIKKEPIDNHVQWIMDRPDMDIRLMWRTVLENPAMIDLIEAYPERYNMHYLSVNPAAIHIIEANLDRVDWTYLSANPAAIHLLEANMDKIDWRTLSSNPAALHLLEANPDNINYRYLSRNPAAMHLLEANLGKIDWIYLSANPAAMHLLEANMDKINWWYLAQNPAAMHILETKWCRVDNNIFCTNPAAIKILSKNKKDINWIYLIRNECDYMQEKIDAFNAAKLLMFRIYN